MGHKSLLDSKNTERAKTEELGLGEKRASALRCNGTKQSVPKCVLLAPLQGSLKKAPALTLITIRVKANHTVKLLRQATAKKPLC